MDEERSSYLQAVERRFVALRGKGWMLSPKDVALVEQWRQAGIPLRVLGRVLTESVQRFEQTHAAGTPLPSSLRYFEGPVEREVARRRAIRVDDGPHPEDGSEALTPDEALQALLARLAVCGQAQTDEAVRATLRKAWRTLKDGGASGSLWSVVTRVDRALVDDLLAGFPPELQTRLEGDARVAVDAARLGAEAARDRLRVELEDRVRAYAGVPDLVEVLDELGL